MAQLAAHRVGAREPLVQALLVHVADGAGTLARVKLHSVQCRARGECSRATQEQTALANTGMHAVQLCAE